MLRARAALRTVILALILMAPTVMTLHAGTARALLLAAVIIVIVRSAVVVGATGGALRERRRCQTHA
jgi:hypothetical protein